MESAALPPAKRQMTGACARSRPTLPHFPDPADLAARNLHNQVESLMSSMVAWSLDDLADRRRRIFGSAGAPMVKTLQNRALSQLLRSQQDSARRESELVTSPPRPSATRQRKLNPVRQFIGPPVQPGSSIPADSFMSPPVKRNFVLLSQPIVTHSPICEADLERATRTGVMQDFAAGPGGVKPIDAMTSITPRAFAFGIRRPSLPSFQDAMPVDEAWPNAVSATGSAHRRPSMSFPSSPTPSMVSGHAGLGAMLAASVSRDASALPTGIGRRKRSWSDLGPTLLQLPASSRGSHSSGSHSSFVTGSAYINPASVPLSPE